MLKISIFLPLLSFLSILISCGSDTKNPSNFVWSNNSKTVTIERNNGNPLSGSLENVYSSEVESLSIDEISYMLTIEVSDKDLYCSNDGVTYKVTIEDGSGDFETYWSANSACGHEAGGKYIRVFDAENLFLLMAK